ncbi:MAG: aminoglycoside phosphotransferase, partial [Rhodanobacteraceae bacterium]
MFINPSTSTDRAASRLAFARAALNDPSLRLERASEDASLRTYWRMRGAFGSAILMDAPPPENEKLAAWLDIDARLRSAGLHAPKVFAEDREAGFVLMEDLG